MPDRRGATVLDDLPDHIVVDKILVLLPPKDIGRCRMVRTSWRSATSTPEFMVEHRRRKPSLPIVDGNGRPASFVALRAAAAAGATSQLHIWPFLSWRRYCFGFRASSDGFFVVVSRGPRGRFYICNPATRKHALLPLPCPPRSCSPLDIYIYGLYQHKSTGEYRVLWSSVHKEEATLYVLTVGASESRSIQLVMPTLLSPSLEQTFRLSQQLSWTAPVHHCGNLHWLLYRPNLIPGICSTGDDIIVFDTEAESFRWMRNPANYHILNRLFEMEGTLAFLGMSVPNRFDYATAMDLWVMQDYGAETWAFKYRIDVSMIEASRPLESTSPKGRRKRKQPVDSTVRHFSDVDVLNERELLVRFNDKHVLRCDIDGQFLGMVTIGKKQYCMRLTGHRIQESIMPIPSGEMQGEDDEFPSSTEHV